MCSCSACSVPPEAPPPDERPKSAAAELPEPTQLETNAVSDSQNTPAPEEASVTPLVRSEEHTSELQSRRDLVCRLLLETKKGNVRLASGLVAAKYGSHPLGGLILE